MKDVEVVALAPQMVSTLQVVEKQDVVGTVPDVVPVEQNTSQFVTGVPVLQGADVMLGCGWDLEVSLPFTSSASPASSSAMFDRLIRGPVSAPALAVPSITPDKALASELRIDPTPLTWPQNMKQRPGSEIPRP